MIKNFFTKNFVPFVLIVVSVVGVLINGISTGTKISAGEYALAWVNAGIVLIWLACVIINMYTVYERGWAEGFRERSRLEKEWSHPATASKR